MQKPFCCHAAPTFDQLSSQSPNPEPGSGGCESRGGALLGTIRATRPVPASPEQAVREKNPTLRV